MRTPVGVVLDHQLRRCRKCLSRPLGPRMLVFLWAFFVLLPSLFLLVTLFSNDDDAVIPLVRAAAPADDLDARGRKVTDGVSLVVGCGGREWMGADELRGVDEVVVVRWGGLGRKSWGNDSLRRRLMEQGVEVVEVVVEEEDVWVLSRAYNVAVGFAGRKRVLKVDCDYTVRGTFWRRHSLQDQDQAFFSGDWGRARDANERLFNGLWYAHRKAILDVGGYDERIQTYGWEDEDLYLRMEEKGLRRKDIDYDTVKYVAHSNELSRHFDVRFPEVERQYNALLVDRVARWNASSARRIASSYIIRREEHVVGGTRLTLYPKEVAPPLTSYVTKKDRARRWNTALGRHLHDTYRIPWDILESVSVPMRERLLKQLLAKEVAGQKTGLFSSRILIAHVMHGLGNRLRALASAWSFADATERVLVVVWDEDSHCRASFGDLFENGLGDADPVKGPRLVVLDRFTPEWPFGRHSIRDDTWRDMLSYNYMEIEGGKKGERVVNDASRNIYFKSAYVMVSGGLTGWEQDNRRLRMLVPVSPVLRLVDQCEADGIRGAIGVHVRSKLLDQDIERVNPTTEYTATDVEVMEYYRKLSEPDRFIGAMREMCRKEGQSGSTKFYVASDADWVVTKMRRIFGRRIIGSEAEPRPCEDRGATCMRRALGELLCLARTKEFLGSFWSSYTEAAQRLGAKKALFAGRDFAVDGAAGLRKPKAVLEIERRAELKKKSLALKKQPVMREQ